MNPFLITGLPRSRTAWMAAASRTEWSICLHEPMAHMGSWDDIFDTVWGVKHPEFVGIADHGLGFHLPEIMNRCSPRVLIIERPVADVEVSCDRIGLPGSRLFLELLSEALAYQNRRILRVPYADLADAHAVRSCLRWLMPGVAIDLDRIAELQGENIQNLDHIDAGKRRSGDLENLLPADVIARLTA